MQGLPHASEISHTGTMENHRANIPNSKQYPVHTRQSVPLSLSDKMSNKAICDKSKWRRRKSCRSPVENDNDDCGSLAWLLNFRLDEFVNVKVPDDEPVVKEARIDFKDVPTAVEKKPPYTYPELIERALRENGELTVSAIYQWISDRFPYYKAYDERWKNSVRHNLSINPHFRKGARAPQGAGHLWSLAANAMDLLPVRSSTRGDVHARCSPPRCESYKADVRMEEATIMEFTRNVEFPKVIVLDEAAIAAASIIPDNELFSGATMFLNPISSEQVVRECGLLVVD